jgi:hypothetical protein
MHALLSNTRKGWPSFFPTAGCMMVSPGKRREGVPMQGLPLGSHLALFTVLLAKTERVAPRACRSRGVCQMAQGTEDSP